MKQTNATLTISLAATLSLISGCHKKSESMEPPPAAAASANSSSPSTKTGFREGQFVAARWHGAGYWGAKIAAIKDGQYDVVYGDGDKGSVTASELLPTSADLSVGDRVLAVWQGAQMYPGKISKKGSLAYTVEWEDGSSPSDVTFDKAAKAPADLPAKAAKPAELLAPNAKYAKATYKTGEHVVAKWGSSSFWYGTVKGKHGDKYAVKYGDGTSGEVAASDMVPMSKVSDVHVGERVMACWHSCKSPLYLGTVQAKTGNAVTVKWQDGSAPSDVKAGEIALF